MEQIFFLVVLLFSAVFHEYMHGWAALQMGDHTAKDMGRLTLNPLVHIDPIMTVLLPALLYFTTQGQFMFAAAKPVPFNPYNLRYPRYGPALVGLAGPIGNFIIAIIFAIILRLGFLSGQLVMAAFIIIFANVTLAIFNLVPIPPLDGSHILTALLPQRMVAVTAFYERYGYFIFIFFLIFFVPAIFPVISFVTRILIGPNIALTP